MIFANAAINFICSQDLPKCSQIQKLSVGTTEAYDDRWIYRRGEVLMRIPCVDGVVYILKSESTLEEDGIPKNP